MNKTKTLEFIKKYTMIMVLIIVTAFFAWRTEGTLLMPMNISSLIPRMHMYLFWQPVCFFVF